MDINLNMNLTEKQYTAWYEETDENEDLPDCPNFVTSMPEWDVNYDNLKVYAYHVKAEVGHYVPFDKDKFLTLIHDIPYFTEDISKQEYEGFRSGNFA